jgi:hypothetical protein
MFPAINFNNHIFLDADKIDYERPYRILPLEFPAAQLPIPQMPPKQSFGIRHPLP